MAILQPHLEFDAELLELLDSPLGVAANDPLVLEAPQFSGGEAPAGVGVAESCASVCDVDLDALDVELPLGFGRD